MKSRGSYWSSGCKRSKRRIVSSPFGNRSVEREDCSVFSDLSTTSTSALISLSVLVYFRLLCTRYILGFDLFSATYLYIMYMHTYSWNNSCLHSHDRAVSSFLLIFFPLFPVRVEYRHTFFSPAALSIWRKLYFLELLLLSHFLSLFFRH